MLQKPDSSSASFSFYIVHTEKLHPNAAFFFCPRLAALTFYPFYGSMVM